MSAKHSPGPWEICGGRRDHAGICQCGLIWSGPADLPVATAFRKDDDVGEITVEAFAANARLIAAAPEMLELLLDFIDDGERGARTYGTWRDRTRELLARIDGTPAP
jgi:hypothetical protein